MGEGGGGGEHACGQAAEPCTWPRCGGIEGKRSFTAARLGCNPFVCTHIINPALPQPARHRFAHARSNNSMTGTLEPGLGRVWPLMELLVLGRNRLRGSIPASFAAMGRLKLLYIL